MFLIHFKISFKKVFSLFFDVVHLVMLVPPSLFVCSSY